MVIRFTIQGDIFTEIIGGMMLFFVVTYTFVALLLFSIPLIFGEVEALATLPLG